MSDQVSVKWSLIPDGTTSIVRVKIEGQFIVNTATATSDAERGIAALIARISSEGEDRIHDKLIADRWLGDYERPDELMPARESEESIPSTSGRALPREGSSVSRRDPMPVLFVLGLAVGCLLAIFGLISIGQFLQEIWRG